MTKYTIPLLEWDSYVEDCWRSRPIKGVAYTITYSHNDDEYGLWDGEDWHYFDALEAAKAAAQEHWESRLKECLTQEDN